MIHIKHLCGWFVHHFNLNVCHDAYFFRCGIKFLRLHCTFKLTFLGGLKYLATYIAHTVHLGSNNWRFKTSHTIISPQLLPLITIWQQIMLLGSMLSRILQVRVLNRLTVTFVNVGSFWFLENQHFKNRKGIIELLWDFSIYWNSTLIR